MKFIRKFLALDWADKFLLGEAWVLLGAARFALLVLPFRVISRHIGPQCPPAEVASATEAVPDLARRITWAVDAMSRHTPWESACLAQALVGKLMLDRRGVASRLYLGTRKDAAGNLAAHAWLKVAGTTVLGGRGHETFTALAAYGATGGQ